MEKKRLLYIDNLRILLITLVILHHFAITYGGSGDWYYVEGQAGEIASIFFTFFLTINQSFFMGFFFMISGYFSARSYDKKRSWSFFGDKLSRLGIPLIVYIIFMDPLINFELAVAGGFKGSFMQFIYDYLGKYDGLRSGPLWFIEALLLFSLVYQIWKAFSKAEHKVMLPTNNKIAIFTLFLALCTFIVRIFCPIGYNFGLLNFQIPYFPQYIALFVVGLVAYKRDWFKNFPEKSARLWKNVVFILLIILPIVYFTSATDGNAEKFLGGITWQSAALSVWEQFFAVSVIITLLIWFRERFDHQNKLLSEMSGSAYTAYIIHAPVLVTFALILRGLPLFLSFKYILFAPLAVGLCFFLGNFIKKLPLAKKIL